MTAVACVGSTTGRYLLAGWPTSSADRCHRAERGAGGTDPLRWVRLQARLAELTEQYVDSGQFHAALLCPQQQVQVPTEQLRPHHRGDDHEGAAGCEQLGDRVQQL